MLILIHIIHTENVNNVIPDHKKQSYATVSEILNQKVSQSEEKTSNFRRRIIFLHGESKVCSGKYLLIRNSNQMQHTTAVYWPFLKI